MKKIIQSLLIVCLSFMLFSCRSEEILENPETQAQFEEYLDKEYKEYFESDYTTYHMSLLYPEKMEIEKPEVTLGDMSSEYYLEIIAENKEDLKELHEFNIKELNESQQRIYRLIERNIEEQIELEKYLDFVFPFEEMGVNYNLVTLFTEFQLRNEEDVQDFILLLKDTQRFLNQGIERTKELANKGFIQHESEKKTIIENCQNFISGNEIQNASSKKLENLDLSDHTKEEYQQQIDEAVKQYVIPVYEDIISMYQELPVSKYQNSLSEIENGKEYYEYLLQGTIGTQKSVKQLMKEAEDQIYKIVLKLYNVFMDENFESDYESLTFEISDASEILKELNEKMKQYYPEIDEVDYRVDYLDASVANDTILAYYLIPPVDEVEKNIIKVNPKVTDLKELTSTLAHEGFPGHLYQNNYLNQKKDHKLYSILGNTGYDEGWAVYVQSKTLEMLEIGSESVQTYEACANYLDYLVVAYLDMGVHYEGWGVKQVENKLTELNLNSEIAELIYKDIIDLPTEFSPYGLGCMEMMILREKCESELKDKFNEVEFHQVLLDSYSVPFEFLEESVNAYLELK